MRATTVCVSLAVASLVVPALLLLLAFLSSLARANPLTLHLEIASEALCGILPLIWLASLVWTLIREGRQTLWLLGFSPVALFWPAAYILLLMACTYGNSCM